MRLFADSGALAEIEAVASWGVLSGATTTLLAPPLDRAQDSGTAGEEVVRLCELLDGPVIVPVRELDAVAIFERAMAVAQLHEHAAVKLGFSAAALVATNELAQEGVSVELARVHSPAQALLAAEAGATWVSCPLGPLEDVGIDAGETLQAIIETLHTGQTEAEVIAAELRSPQHAVLAARLGSEIAAVAPELLGQMAEHPLNPR
jgi:transaldolase